MNMRGSNRNYLLPEGFEAMIFRRAAYWVGSFVALIWVIKIMEALFGIQLTTWGVLPRTWEGLKGILFSPLLHSDFLHLISNSLPLLILGLGIFYLYARIAPEVMVWMYLSSGIWVWSMARGGSYHLGASGLVYGLAAFLIVGGIIRKSLASTTLSLVVLLLYGGMFLGILPGEPGISWESHLMGALSGAGLAVYFRKEPLWTIPSILRDTDEDIVEDDKALVHEEVNEGKVAQNFPYSFTPGEEGGNDES